MKTDGIYVQYGCGLSAPKEWINFDASPTLRIQKFPLVKKLIGNRLNAVFPANVRYGDIVKGLPVDPNTCDAVYCSHVLEHLSLNDFRKSLANTFKILKPGRIFRCVVPDLEVLANNYLNALKTNSDTASIDFIGKNTLLGLVDRPRGVKGIITSSFGNSHHLWMWDHYSLTAELSKVGFKKIRRASFNDSSLSAFKLVEDPDRFEAAVALECIK